MHLALIALLFSLQAGQSSAAFNNPVEWSSPRADQASPADLSTLHLRSLSERRLRIAQVNPTFGPPDPERWNRVYSDPTPTFNTAPNAFMKKVVKGLKPGRTIKEPLLRSIVRDADLSIDEFVQLL